MQHIHVIYICDGFLIFILKSIDIVDLAHIVTKSITQAPTIAESFQL